MEHYVLLSHSEGTANHMAITFFLSPGQVQAINEVQENPESSG
ncbi:conserved hypothetical protein [Xylella fastidiosa M12]|nr:conserved hypothetical protein [Xylella fastidiosa M12]